MDAILENIQHCSLHDGPGIRTTLFFKGCPLRCAWCSNPDTQSFTPEVLFISEHCLGCGQCVEACPEGIVKTNNGLVEIERSRCDACGKCVSVCSGRALRLSGKKYSVDEAFEHVRLDAPFYRNSGGGVTLSGGEVLAQAGFAMELCQRCVDMGIHTAIETSAFAPEKVFLELAGLADIVFLDIKHLDSNQHKKFTGQGNERILANLAAYLEVFDKVVHIRLPLIEGVNDDEEHLRAYGSYLAGLRAGEGKIDLEVLPYHRLGKDKYRHLGRAYAFAEAPPMPRGKAESAVRILKEAMKNIHVFCSE